MPEHFPTPARSLREEGALPAPTPEVDVLLQNKIALVYGAGGDIGAAVARAFAREGAKLFLSGRTLRNVEAVAALRAVSSSPRCRCSCRRSARGSCSVMGRASRRRKPPRPST